MKSISLNQEQHHDDVIIKCDLETMAETFYENYENLWHAFPAFAPIFNDRDKSHIDDLPLYLKVIPQFKNWKQAKKDLMSLTKRVYLDKKVANFEQNYNGYNKEAILKWYTQQSFLHDVINNCLRIATSDSIQWSRLLLKDIERAIKDQYQAKSKNFSGTLFRAAYLSKKEWLSLKENVNREIEMLGFLSVSKEKSVAVELMKTDTAQKVFITILMLKGPVEEEQGFAEIEEFSEFPDEKEVLFNVRSRFTVLEAEDEYSKDLRYRHLVLLYGTQGLRRFIAEKNPTLEVQDVKNISCSHCKVPTTKVTDKMLFMSMADIEKRIYSCQKCLGKEAVAPFLCVPIKKNPSNIKVRGCLLMKSSQTQIPLYGYKCIKCKVKNQKRYFVCTDCYENKMKWCESCFGNSLHCIQMGHCIILESFPFSFWSEKMSENELNHLQFQESLIRKNNDELQQATMFHKTRQDQKEMEFYKGFIQQKEEKGKNREFAFSYNNIGLIYHTQGEYKKALGYCTKSLNVERSVHRENHLNVATSYNNIGELYHTQGEYQKALESHLKSLEIKESIHGENHPDVAASYNSIGSIYDIQREYKKALEYHSKSLEIRKSVHRESHPDVAASYNNIGLIFQNQGKFKKALEYHFKSLEIRKSVHGENHPDVATSYSNIGLVYNSQGEYKKALEYHSKSLEIKKLVCGVNHPDVAVSYNSIGSNYEAQGEYNKALEYHLKSLEIKESIHREYHLNDVVAYKKIGSLYEIQGQYKEALEYYLQSLRANISVHRENHPDVVASYNHIGMIYKIQGDYEKALEYYFKSLEINKRIHGENHSDVAASYNNIGSVYETQREYKKAVGYHFRSLEIRKSVHGINHPDFITSYNKIGLIYKSQGEEKTELPYYLKFLEISKTINKQDYPQTATLED